MSIQFPDVCDKEYSFRYRVWPDGTVQEVSETPYSFMSDDYMIVFARDEEDALKVYKEVEYVKTNS